MCGLFPSNYALEHPASSEGIQERIFPPRLLGIACDGRQKQHNGKQFDTEVHACFMTRHRASLLISNSSTCFMELHSCALFGCFSEYSLRFIPAWCRPTNVATHASSRVFAEIKPHVRASGKFHV